LSNPFVTRYIQTVHMKLSVECECHEYSSHKFGSLLGLYPKAVSKLLNCWVLLQHHIYCSLYYFT